jgi:Domain of unknown function (DUF3806)
MGRTVIYGDANVCSSPRIRNIGWHSLRYAWILLVGGIVLGCSRTSPQEKKVPFDQKQKTSALTDTDQKRLSDQRAVVERYLGGEDSTKKYKTVAGKLGTIRAILQGNIFKREQTYELQCLGIVLGDAFVQELGMEWIMVEDEHGSDPGVRMPKTSIIIFPMTMISKRIEAGEQVDVFDLFNKVTTQVEELVRQGV